MAKKHEEMKAQANEVETPKSVDMKALEEAAMAKVLKKLGITEDDVDSIAKSKAETAEAKELVKYDLGGLTVRINGQEYGKGEAPREVVATILSMAANKKNRLLQEMIGKEGMANLMSGVIKAEIPVTSQKDAHGLQVNQ